MNPIPPYLYSICMHFPYNVYCPMYCAGRVYQGRKVTPEQVQKMCLVRPMGIQHILPQTYIMSFVYCPRGLKHTVMLC